MTEKEETIFGKILCGDVPCEKVWQDDRCIAFRDIAPVAPRHILVIPRKYIPTVNDLTEADESLVGHLIWVAAQIARREGFADDGYRLVMNCNKHGGQAVYHLHLHILGGRQMEWPPG